MVTSLIWNLKRWDIFTIPDSYAAAKKALDTAKRDSLTKMVFKGSGYYRGYFNLKRVGDTFLNMENWGKGQVYVNGHAIGRFWSIGPQQTLYVPGCWLKKGKNEVVVLDVVGPSAKAFYFTKDKKRLSPWLFAQNKPELDKLNVEKSRTHNDPANQPDLNSATPAHVGQLAADNGWQMVRFAAPQTGRYLAIHTLSTHEGKDVVSVAELYAVNAVGARLSREPWTVKYADSEETKRGNNTAEKSFDLQESTYWRTERGAALPHLMVIDLGSEQTITGFDYLPRAEEGAPGSIKDYKIFVY